MKKKDVALVLSSGGAKGFAHVGVIHALERNGFNIHSVAGASMGSLVGGLYATGELESFIDFMENMDLREMLKFVDINLGPGGMVKGDRIIEKLKELVPDRNIAPSRRILWKAKKKFSRPESFTMPSVHPFPFPPSLRRMLLTGIIMWTAGWLIPSL